MDSDHEKFLTHLDASQECVWLAARWLRDRGHKVTVPPYTKAPTHAAWKSHADNGDLEIARRIEVKGLSAQFTGAHDWPFQEGAIVCAKHAWDRANPKPYAFLQFAADRKTIAIVYANTYTHWVVSRKKDRRYADVEQDFLMCPIMHVEFHQVTTD